MRNIKCQDCDGTGLNSGLCSDHMCRDPETCTLSGPDFPCITCKGQRRVDPDETNRWWAVPHYSKAKKAADKKNAQLAKELRIKAELKCLASEAIRMEREAAKIRKRLSKEGST